MKYTHELFKCLCGYEYQEELNEKWEVIKGDEEFMKIDVQYAKMLKYDEMGHEWEIKLCACPKCGTVRWY